MIYFDQASTSYPKPLNVINCITEYLCHYGVSPGRGVYELSEKSYALIEETRTKLAYLIGGENKDNLVFTNNATHSLNLAGAFNQKDLIKNLLTNSVKYSSFQAAFLLLSNNPLPGSNILSAILLKTAKFSAA